MLIFSFNTFAQNYISTKTTPGSGNIYHTGGNLGIGTTEPQKSIDISADYSNGIGIAPTIRFSNRFITTATLPTFWWDIQNDNTNLSFIFGGNQQFSSTKFQIDSTGRILINNPAPEESAILQIYSHSKGILIPRMSSNNIDLIHGVDGLLVYNKDISRFMFFDGKFNDWTTLSTDYDNNQKFLTITNFNNHVCSTITQQNLDDWNTAFSWGNHADSGYITAVSVDELKNKSGNISMWTNDAGYITDANIPTLFWKEGKNGITYNNGFVGIGTAKPDADLHIATKNNKSTIRLTNTNQIGSQDPPTYSANNWDIINSNSKILFSYFGDNQLQATKASISSNGTITASNATLSGNVTAQNGMFSNNISASSATLSGNVTAQNGIFSNNISTIDADFRGTVNAQSFVGDGSQLTNLPIPESVWLQNGDDVFYDNGYVGIGTNTPLYPLHIKSNSPNIMLDIDGSTNNYSRLLFSVDENIKAQFYYDNKNKNLILTNNDITALKINQNGNIKIEDNSDINFNTFNGLGRYSATKPFADYQNELGIVLYGDPGGALGGYYWDNGAMTQHIVMRWRYSSVYFGSNDLPVNVYVNGTVKAQKFYAENNSWPDYVFANDYDLMPLDGLQDFIQTNQHLPNVPSEQEVLDNGVELANVQAIQMEKIEELTLYILELNEIIKKQQEEIEELKKTVNQ